MNAKEKAAGSLGGRARGEHFVLNAKLTIEKKHPYQGHKQLHGGTARCKQESILLLLCCCCCRFCCYYVGGSGNGRVKTACSTGKYFAQLLLLLC